MVSTLDQKKKGFTLSNFGTEKTAATKTFGLRKQL
jgi:hypothetical protein